MPRLFPDGPLAVVVFKLPELAGGRDWLRLVDTNLLDEDDEFEDAVRFAFGDEYDATARSLLLFLLRPERRRGAHGPRRARSPPCRGAEY